MDLKSVLTIASFLFFAQVISQTGVLNMVAAYMESNITNPKLLVIAIMIITSLVSGIFSAGPAAAAMMPIIIQICNGPLGFIQTGLQLHMQRQSVVVLLSLCGLQQRDLFFLER